MCVRTATRSLLAPTGCCALLCVLRCADMRVIGADDVIALGDCSKMIGSPLPPTAQVGGAGWGWVWGVGEEGGAGWASGTLPCALQQLLQE